MSSNGLSLGNLPILDYPEPVLGKGNNVPVAKKPRQEGLYIGEFSLNGLTFRVSLTKIRP